MMKKRIIYSLLILIGIGFPIYVFAPRPFHYIVPAALLILFLISLVLVRGGGSRISAGVNATGAGEKEEPVRFTTEVQNRSFFPVLFGELSWRAENRLTGETLNGKEPFSCLPRGKARITVTLRPLTCGTVDFTCETLTVRGILGVLTRSLAVDVKDSFVILPRIFPYELDEDSLDAYDPESFRYAPDRPGQDPGDIFALREYRPQDSFKAIHWKLSGKMDSLYVKEFGYPIEHNLLILVDKFFAPSMDGKAAASEADRLTETLFSLSGALADKGIHHDVGWYDAGEESFLLRSVEPREDSYASLLEILSARILPAEDGFSTVRAYLQADAPKNYSNIILLSDEATDVEKLAGYGNYIAIRTK